MIDEVYINGKDAYAEWGITFDSSSLSSLMTPPPMKTPPENNSRLHHGKIVDYSNPKVDTNSITLTFNLSASTETEFFRRYHSFCEELKTGKLVIINRHIEDVYRMKYVSCTQFTEFMYGIAQFSLRLEEPNPMNRGNNDINDIEL